jgi:hypothetical protein
MIQIAFKKISEPEIKMSDPDFFLNQFLQA